MGIYKKILVCLDLSDDCEKVAQRAMAFAGEFGGELTLLHVVEYVPVEPMGEALLPAVQIEGELVERAKVQMDELAKRLGLEQCERIVQTGNIKTEVVRIAEARGTDLIVIGSRGRHGVSILFNFTEDTVLHAAPCDVLGGRRHHKLQSPQPDHDGSSIAPYRGRRSN